MVASARLPAVGLSDVLVEIEVALREAVFAATHASPPHLAAAIRYATAPGGGRLRPQLTKLVARCAGDEAPATSTAAAIAIELVHCASLVHDDLPCFDDADTRRGKPSVHRAYGEPVAVLVGDALIVLAFDVLGHVRAPARTTRALVSALALGTGASGGIIAGQAWESEPAIPLDAYHRAKTASLFAAAAAMGAISASVDPAPWRIFGERLGQAYQAADDVADATGDPAQLGKPVGRDALLARPNVVRAHGVERARARVQSLVEEALAAIPNDTTTSALRDWVASAFALTNRRLPRPR